MNTNVNTKYPPMKGGNNEQEYMNTMASQLNYKTASNRYAGSNMMYMNNTLGQNINPTMNHMNNQMNSMRNNIGGEMNVMSNSIHPSMNNQKNIYNLNNEMNENIMNKNLYGDMNKTEKISFTNFGMNKFNNNENIKLKTDEYNKYSNVNQENLLMNKTQRKINFMNKNVPSMGTNMSNNMSSNMGVNMGTNMGTTMGTTMGANMSANMSSNMGTNMSMLNDGKIKPFGSSLMNHNVNSTSSNILPGLNKNLNIFENTKIDNKLKKNTYENMFQNPHTNSTAMGNVNIGTRNDSNNAMHGMKNNMNTFMQQGISGINKPSVLPNKGVGLNMYTDNIINALNTKTKDAKLKLFDGGINKLIETEPNNAMNNPLNNPMKQNISLNTFATNQTNSNINNAQGENQFGQMGRVGAMNPMQTFNTSVVNANMGNVHNNMNNNLTHINNVNRNNANMNTVNIMGINPMGNVAGINDPLLRKMADTSNRTVPNTFGKNIVLTNPSVNNMPNSNLINPFNTTNVNKGVGMTNKGDMTVAATNHIGGVHNEKGSLNMFQKPYNSFLNMNAQPNVPDNSLHVRDTAGPFSFMQGRQLGNERNKILEVNQNNVKTGATSSMNSLNQMNIMNRNMNMLNNNMGTIGNIDGINNMNAHVNRSDMQEMGANQRGLMNQTGINPVGISQMGMNYMNTVPVMGGTLMMNTMNEQGGVTSMLTMKQNDTETKPVDAMDFRKEHLPNKPMEFAMNDNTQQENVSIDNYANLLKQLCTPVKNKPAATKIETFNEDMFNFEENESANPLNNEDAQAGMFKKEAHATENPSADMGNNNTVQNSFMENPMLLQNKNETNMNEFRNATVNNVRSGNKEGNIYELKKLNLFAENKKRDKEAEVENKSSQIKTSKTKVFFYMNPKYILEPLKRKIYEKMSFYIENLISDIKSIENKDRSKILEELHATSWFFQVFDFDAISKLLNVFNKYLIYSDSLIIPDVLISNKLDVDGVNNAFASGTSQVPPSGTAFPGAAANYHVANNANFQGNGSALMMKNNDIISGGDDYVKNFHFYFKRSEKLDLLNQKMHDYESNIIENVDKLNYMKELCENLKSQILLKKRTFLLLLEKAKLKNYTYRNEQLQTILNIDKKTKMDKSLALNNEYYTMFKKINEGLNILKGYSHLMVTYPNLVNDVLSCESVKMYESTKSSEEGDEKKKKVVIIEDDEGGASGSNSVNVSPTNKTKHKRKMEEQDKDDRDAILSMHSSFEEDEEEEECKKPTDVSKRKKRKTIKEIKHMHKQMENNEEWVDDFLDDF